MPWKYQSFFGIFEASCIFTKEALNKPTPQRSGQEANMNEVETYIDGFSGEARDRLLTIREMVRACAPAATERICMRIPTFDLNGKWLVHYAAFEKHIGFYPQPETITAFKEQLAGYKTSKGAVQFPLAQPLPLGLIQEMIRFRVEAQSN
jgi:uncharacterized protein YdhG (YjbR/CyaY superfamily)